MPASAADVERVTELLGRAPRADFEVVVRTADGEPAVIRNAPLLADGTPMPTRYWLVAPELVRAVSRLEADGGVRAANAAVDPKGLAAAHAEYAAERSAALPEGWTGPEPFGGVGGTRRGVKCLHAHYAWYLAGGADPVGQWVEERIGDALGPGEHGVRVAAFDIGTNSTRLLVGELTSRSGPLVTLERRMTITRLGEGVDATRRLAPVAIDRTLAALREYRTVIDSLGGVEAARATATSAARDATNRDEFFVAASAIIGTELELISGEEEAALSFLGATTELPSSVEAPYLVVDIGGGSTEFVVGTTAPEGAMSVDVGCVRITEAWLHSDPPAPEELSQAVHVVREHVVDVMREVPEVKNAKSLIGLAGTVTTVAAIELGLPEYDAARIHHSRLTRVAVEDVFRTLATESAELRRHNPGLEPGRVDVIVGGVIVLATILRTLGFEELLVSEADILDGLVRSLIPAS